MELKSEAVVRKCSVKKVFSKFLKILRKISVPESRESGKDDSLIILRNFQEYLFCRTSVNAYLREMKQRKNVLTNIFTENHRWWCPLKYSCRIEDLEHGRLQFYLKGTQSQILFRKTCQVLQNFSFTQHYLLLRNCFWFRAALFGVSLSLSAICQFSHN